MTGPRTDLAHLRALLTKVLDQEQLPGRTQLLGQVGVARVRGGTPTSLELVVDAAAPRAEVDDGAVPVATVQDASGNEIGELIVWVRAGSLDGLEFAWWCDEPPTEMPALEAVVPAPPT